MRVLDDYGVLIFKWSECQLKVKTVINEIGNVPLFGHKTNHHTIWLCYMKIPTPKKLKHEKQNMAHKKRAAPRRIRAWRHRRTAGYSLPVQRRQGDNQRGQAERRQVQTLVLCGRFNEDEMKAKIERTIKRIQVASHIAERHGEVMVVCFSGGKDSQVMLHLVQRAGGKYKAVYNVTTVDHPANVNFIRKEYTEVQFIHPKLNFWDLCKKKKMLPTMRFRFCCSELKEYYGGHIRAIGCRREESFKRSKYKILEIDKVGLRFYPIIDWTELDIWNYIEDNHIPVNPCYDFCGRVGCMICPYAPAKQIYDRFIEFPSLKKKMIDTIRYLRENSRFCIEFQDKTDDEILYWWMSKRNIREYFQPQFEFEK